MIVATGLEVTTEGNFVVMNIQGEGGPYSIGVTPAAAYQLQVALSMRAREITSR
ncbi:hypothetical protein [Mycobacterium sp. IS-836]|uniref:hypothetical protein n=1 Tax=Mycobacterium sp. IS-836 TaxID=1834160 RepID=UPI001301734A|nr:hypothetical protein [Mycobacterium sp. IS-836]